MGKLSTKARKRLPDFALPSKRKYPIENKSHARNALVAQHGTSAEKATVRRKAYAKYPSLKAVK